MVLKEQGVAMLSSVLKSEKAIQVNIEIMRAFSKYRSYLMENEFLRNEIKRLDSKLDQSFRYLLQQIDSLREKPKGKIGFTA